MLNGELRGHPVTLKAYIEQLVGLMRESEPGAYDRLTHVVGRRKAIIGLDHERVAVRFVKDVLRVRRARKGEQADGTGFTDSETVNDLLDARLEVSMALRLGRIEAHGTPVNIDRIFAAIEILLDVATRSPAMQRLSAQFQSELGRQTFSPIVESDVHMYPFPPSLKEYDMLSRLDLLP